MRVIIVTTLCFISFNGQLTAQNCDTSLIELKGLIKDALPFRERNYLDNKSESFILEFKLNDRRDSIISADYWKRSTSIHDSYIIELLKKIQLNWVPGKCEFDRLIVPVFILFFSEPAEERGYPLKFETGKIFYILDKGTYYTPDIVIGVRTRRDH